MGKLGLCHASAPLGRLQAGCKGPTTGSRCCLWHCPTCPLLCYTPGHDVSGHRQMFLVTSSTSLASVCSHHELGGGSARAGALLGTRKHQPSHHGSTLEPAAEMSQDLLAAQLGASSQLLPECKPNICAATGMFA